MEELKGTKNISNVTSAKIRVLLPKIKNMEGETITTKGIANVFAEFYAKLCGNDEGEENKKEKEAQTYTECKEKISEKFEPNPEFTKCEIQDAIDRRKRGNAEDSSGVRAEQSKIAVMSRKKR